MNRAGVIGVLGGSGGVGCSSFAAALAQEAGRSLLVDLDAAGGGIDVLLGIEDTPGARWSGLHLAGGHLDPVSLMSGLPRWRQVGVLAADVDAIDASAVDQVLAAAAQAGPVIVDLPRGRSPHRSVALEHCELIVVIVRADVGGLASAHAQAGGLPGVAGALVRRGSIPASQAAHLIGLPLLGELGALSRTAPDVQIANAPRSLRRIAAGLVGGVGTRHFERAAG